MTLTEDMLAANIKQSKFDRIYYFYGKEVFLTKTYVDRIVSKAVNDFADFNVIKFSGNIEISTLCDIVEQQPMMADYKVIVLNDIDFEKFDSASVDKCLAIFADVPSFDIIVINITGFDVDMKKAKTKKLLAAIDKYGVICQFSPLTPAKIATLVAKKATKLGITITRENATYIATETLCNLTLASIETDKLCSYVGKGNEITKEIIDKLIAKQLETSIYVLATTITANKKDEAFSFLNSLIYERYEPVAIMSALSSAFVDFYHVSISGNVSIGEMAVQFNYPKNRVWILGKIQSTVSNLSLDYLSTCINILYDTDRKLKSSSINSRYIMEETITKLLMVKNDKAKTSNYSRR